MNKFAKAWKTDEGFPNLKFGNFEENSNTRPISLPILISFHSVESILLYFTEEILRNMDTKKISLALLLDMPKAFDSIRHDLLLAMFKKVGVSDYARAWSESCLSQQVQVVRIQDTLLKSQPISVGVLLGSIPGPVIFTLCVDDLLSVPTNCKSVGCVDDSKIFPAFPPFEETDAVTALNDDIQDTSSWFCANSLLINPKKTKL